MGCPLRGAARWVLVSLGCAAGGCTTPLGNYFANRARDLGECFRIEVGHAVGLGGGVNVAGIASAGLGAGVLNTRASVGVTYGRLVYDLPQNADLRDAARGNAESYALLRHWSRLRAEPRESFGLLPALFTWVGDWREDGAGRVAKPWLWGDSDSPDVRWARVHAFDVEVGAYALFIGARIGFSLGELLDFLGGWVGWDPAGDDREWAAPDAARPP